MRRAYTRNAGEGEATVAEQTMVRVYKRTETYQQDAQLMADGGWRVVNVVERQPRVGALRRFFLARWLKYNPPYAELVVTYGRSR